MKDFWRQHRKHLIPLPIVLGLGLGSYTAFTFNGWLVLYIAAIFIPLVLGMMEKVRFRWVLLWEMVVLLPVGLIVAVLFGGAILQLFRRS